MSKPNCGLIRFLLGAGATVAVRNEGPLILQFSFLLDTDPVQSLLLRDLALNQGQRCSTF